MVLHPENLFEDKEIILNLPSFHVGRPRPGLNDCAFVMCDVFDHRPSSRAF